MILFKTGHEMAGWARQQRIKGRQIGFVPTMGALHPGHISLIDLSRNALPLTVCSIFVNPTQFNDPRDFKKYPITLENDIYLLEKAGVDVLFLPGVEEMYPEGVKDLEHYALGNLESLWEGKFRPGHFQGVCQVVRRLLDRVQPHDLFMGRKDYQQCLVIRRLLELTGSATLLHTGPIMREADGLAMSSRNQRLTIEERKKAPAIYRALSWLKEHWPGGEPEKIMEHARTMLTEQGFRIDYIEVVDQYRLEPLTGLAGSHAGYFDSDGALALAAAFLGEVRLIDNLLLKDH